MIITEQESELLTVGGIDVQITRKAIKNLHLSVNPPGGVVRVSAPLNISADNIRLRIVDRLPWIKRQQAAFVGQPRQPTRNMVSGETHFYLGRPYRLSVTEGSSTRSSVVIQNNSRILLQAPVAASVERKLAILERWYRSELKVRIPTLIDKWEPIIDRGVSEWGVKKMKTKWGSCNTEQARIWLNLELAKKPVECLEYIVVHEMVHLLERNHSDKFKRHMDRFLPDWTMRRDLLNAAPLANTNWHY